jgi:natural product biosynthesis luciferase-like monooxygenase protein
MNDLTTRLEALSPKRRELLELELRKRQASHLIRSGQSARAAMPAMPAKPAESAESARREGPPSYAGAFNPAVRTGGTGKGMRFSLFFFSDDGTNVAEDKYRLLLECARFADAHDFTAIWTPERHFQDFGGLYPNPSVLGAALAMITERLQIRAGSVALPLHSPIRVAEEWSVVDNLSKGRVGVSFASGWHPYDFVLAPQAYEGRKEIMFENVRLIQRLWAGETIGFQGVDGTEAQVRVLPKPIQSQLPTWITIASSTESWIKAGEIGANVLTIIVKQPLEVLREKISLYRGSLARHGHDPASGQVAVMLHACVGPDNNAVREKVRGPLSHYFRSNLKQLDGYTELLAKLRTKSAAPDVQNLTESDLDAVAAYAFERYFETSLLCGTPDKCSRLVDQLIEIGVDEAACLVDFGLGFEDVMESLQYLNILRERYALTAERETVCA